MPTASNIDAEAASFLQDRAGRFSWLALRMEGIRRSVLPTLARIEHFCSMHGVTTLSNDRICKELGMDRSTLTRHLQKLEQLGLVLAVFGKRKDPSAKFHGYSRWLFTPSRRFPKAIRKASSCSNDAPLSFFGPGPQVNRRRTAEAVWRFLATQDALFPGTAAEAAKHFFSETGEPPLEVAFEGRFDTHFFQDLRASYCCGEVCKNAVQSLPTEDQPLSFSAGPKRKLKHPSTKQPPTPDAAAHNAVPPADATPPNCSADKHFLFTSHEYLIPRRVRSLLEHHIEEVEVICALVPSPAPELWAPIHARRLRKQLRTGELTLAELDLLQKHLPRGWQKKLSLEILSEREPRMAFLQQAAYSFRKREIRPLSNWLGELREKWPWVVAPLEDPAVVERNMPWGWLGGRKAIEDAAQDYPDEGVIDSNWATSVVVRLMAPAVYPNHPEAKQLESEGRQFLGALGDDAFLAIGRHPMAWRLLLGYRWLFCPRQFEVIFGFSVENLKNYIRLDLEYKRAKVADLQKLRWVDEISDPNGESGDEILRIPSVDDFAPEKIARMFTVETSICRPQLKN